MAILQYREVDNFKSRVNEILKPLQEGMRTGVFTPKLLNISTLRNIINQHPKLENTIYSDHPSLLYTTSKSTIAEVTKDVQEKSFSVHLILTIPLLKPEQILHSFKVTQTGFYYDGKCWYHELPKHVYQKVTIENNKEVKSYYSLDDVNCEEKTELLKFCNLNVTKTLTKPLKIMEVECLSKTPNKCHMYTTKCTENVIYNVHGLLTRSDNKIKGILKTVKNDKKVLVWDPTKSRSRTQYWPWREFDFIELDSGVARASDYQGNIEMADLEQQTVWWETIEQTNKQLESRNLTKAYHLLKQSLNTLQNEKEWFAEKPTSMVKDILIMAAVLGIIGIIITAMIKYIKQHPKKKTAGYTNKKTDETHMDELQTNNTNNNKRYIDDIIQKDISTMTEVKENEKQAEPKMVKEAQSTKGKNTTIGKQENNPTKRRKLEESNHQGSLDE